MEYQPLTRDQIKLLLRPARSHTKRLRRFDARVSWIGLLGAALIYSSINLPAFIALNRSGDPRLAPAPLSVTVDTAAAANESTPAESTPTPVEAPAFVYEKLGISAPIEWNVPYSTGNVKTALQSGLGHIGGSALPGNPGTAIITGHSSNLAWAKGDYKTIFAPLLKSQLDDTFRIVYNNQTFAYKVTQVYEVDPGKIEILSGTENVHIRLITCTPLGTDKRRLIVDAVQTDPTPSIGAWQKNSINSGKIVATR